MTTVVRSVHRFLALVVLLPFAAISPIASAAPATIPGFPTPDKSAGVSVLLSGGAGELPSAPWLVIEQLDLAEGDTVPALTTTQIIVNQEGELSLIDDLGLEASLPEGEGLHVPAGDMGDLTADSDTTILRISLANGEPKSDPLMAAELPDDTPDPADLWFARITLPAGASLGDATTLGPTAIVSLDADLAVIRPDRLPATLPADKGILLPTGTQLEVRNDGTTNATVLLAGLAPSDRAAASATTNATPRATATPEPRASTRNVTPTPTRRATATPRPSATATSQVSTGGFTSLYDFQPSMYALAAVGFAAEGSWPIDLDRSAISVAIADTQGATSAWRAGRMWIYSDGGDSETVPRPMSYVTAENFSSAAVAHNVFTTLAVAYDAGVTSYGRFDEVFAMDVYTMSAGVRFDGRCIYGRSDSAIVIVCIYTDEGRDTSAADYLFTDIAD